MAITIYKVRGQYNAANHRDYLLDFDSEFNNLPGLNVCAVGSHAYSAESGKTKILNSAGSWVDDKTGTSTGGGGSGGPGAMHWIGVTTTALTDGATTNPITINGESVTAEAGDIAQYNSKEFIFSGSAWQAFSDEQIQSDWDQTDSNAPDYIKNKPTIPDAQIQSDWDQTNSSAKDFIKNKPTVLSESDVNTLIENSLDYDNLSHTPMSISEPTFTQEDSIGTGYFMGAAWTKISAKPFPVNELVGGTVSYGATDLVLTSTNVQDAASFAGSMGYSGTMMTVITPSGVATNIDFKLIALDAAWTLAQYGINLEAGTYIATDVTELALPKSIVINPDYAGNLLPAVTDGDDRKTMEVVGGKWITGGQHSIAGVEDWSRIQRVMRGSMNQVIFPVWSQIRVPHKEFGIVTFDVVAHDTDLDPSDSSRHTMTLLMRDALQGFQFDATEALCVCTNGLAAGTYYYGDLWWFVLEENVPAGGVLVLTIDMMSGHPVSISSYASISATTPIETSILDSGTNGTDLTSVIASGDMNALERASYGSNNWYQSGIRQYLNATGDAGSWWSPATKFDRPPSYTNKAGFLAGFPADFVAAMVQTQQVTNTNQVFETDMTVSTYGDPYTYTTTDKMFLGSWTQYNGGQWSDQADENSVWTAFANSGTVDSDDRVKYDFGGRTTPQWYWTRSCVPGYSCIARGVDTAGDPNLIEWACYPTHALAAACVIGAV